MEHKRPGLLRRFFGFLWSALNGLRRLVLNLLFLSLLALVVVALVSEEAPNVPANSALVINPSGVLVDQLSYSDPFSAVVAGSDAPAETLLSDVVEAIDTAGTDARIKLLVLQTDGLEHGGISKQQELAAALARFRGQGKKIVALGDSFNQDQYLLATQADSIFMNPMGQVLLQGYGAYSNYFKEALDKLQVNVHVFRVGTYKSAVEPLLRDDMSTEVKENHLVWLNSLWRQYTDAVAKRRGLEPAKLDEYINRIDTVFAAADGDTARAAVDWRLVDGLKSRLEMNDWLVEQVGADEHGDFRGIAFDDYLAAQRHMEVGAGGDKVAVIVASGMILDGEQRAGQIGGDTLSALIREASDDEHVKAVVLRIDSEGGSAFASEIIRQELLDLQSAGKPLVVSMGSVAASGGYWIAAGADEVWATPGTITGSIGIFGAFPTLENTLGKLGVHTDGVGTTAMAGAMRIDRPLDAVAARAIQSNIERGYRQFLQVVADGRDLEVARVDALAQGRVWAGSDAAGVGLVDKLGGLSDAIAAAAGRAGLKQYETEWLETPLTPPELLLQKLGGAHSSFADGRALGWLTGTQAMTRHWLNGAASWSPLRPLFDQVAQLRILQTMSRLNDPKAMYVYCTGCARL
jgi:protease IV